MAYIQTANRTIERSPNVAAIGADRLSRLTGLSREPSTSQGERARRVVETAVGPRTSFSNANLQKRARKKVALQNALNIKQKTL